MSSKTQDPFVIRRELARRFPRWTQRLWTYQMALTAPGEPRRTRWSQSRHLIVWLVVYLGSTALSVASVSWLLNIVSTAVRG
jgi:hypothetical protein